MALLDIAQETRLSDIVFHEQDPCVGAAREDINVTPTTTPIKAGTVVFRALSELDQYAPYTVLTDAAALTVENEFGIVIGDQFSFRSEFTPKAVADKTFNAVVLKRGNIQVKEYLPKQIHGETLGEDFETLRELLKRQGVIMELTV